MVVPWCRWVEEGGGTFAPHTHSGLQLFSLPTCGGFLTFVCVCVVCCVCGDSVCVIRAHFVTLRMYTLCLRAHTRTRVCVCTHTHTQSHEEEEEEGVGGPYGSACSLLSEPDDS